MRGTFGLLSSQGDRSRVDSFGERYGGAAMDDVGPTKNLSSIPITVIKPVSGTAAAPKQQAFTLALPKSRLPWPAVRSLTTIVFRIGKHSSR